jgi:muconolactone delta-isomerase
MLFSVRLVSRQPHDIDPDSWQSLVTEQLRFVKGLYEQGKIKAIYREAGLGVLAVFDVADPRELDQHLAQLPMARYFESTTVHAMWDMVPALEAV